MLEHTVCGVRVRVSLLFPAALVFLCAWDRSGTAAAGLYASLWHETGHLLALCLLRCRPRSLTFGAFGMRLCIPGRLMPGERIVLSLFGPLFNGLAAAVLFLLHRPNGAALHLILGGFNLLPIVPLDGGQALYAALERPLSERGAGLVLSVTSAVTVLPLLSAAVWVLWSTGYNFTLLLVCLYLIFLLFFKKKG